MSLTQTLVGATRRVGEHSRRDLSPQSAAHWIRLILAFMMVTVALGLVVLRAVREKPGDGHELIMVIILLVFGLGTAFTNSMVELLKAIPDVLRAIPFPWVKKTNGAPPAA